MQVVSISLIKVYPFDIKISDVVEINHLSYSRALKVDKRLNWPTTRNLFVDQDGTVVGFFMQDGNIIRVGAQVAEIQLV